MFLLQIHTWSNLLLFAFWLPLLYPLLIECSSEESRKSYANYSLISVTCETQEQVDFLERIQREERENGTFGIDMWQPAIIHHSTDILVHPDCYAEFVEDLDRLGLSYEIKVSDMGNLIDSEAMQSRRSQQRDGSEKYLTLSEIEEHLRDLEKKHPNVVTVESIGSSNENRSITVIRLHRRPNKPVIWIDAGIHAREWIAPATVLYLINKLLTDETLKPYLDDFDWRFLPVMNPDGYLYTHTTDRMWRKNRRRGPCRCYLWTKICCHGVDLNRNFDYEWGGTGTSKNPCDGTYGGSSAFSEPESAAIRDYLLRIASTDEIVLYLTLHSYGQYWVYPFSHRPNTYPDDGKELVNLANRATAALEGVYGSKYRVGTAADIMYATTGSSADWAKSVAKIKYVYGVELRPSNEKRPMGTASTGFIIPAHEIPQSGEEIWAAIRELLTSIQDSRK